MPPVDWTAAPAIRVDGLAAGRMVLDVAGGHPVRLISTRGIGGLAGAGWWAALQSAWAVHAKGPFQAILDCADLPGLVLSGLRAGCTDIIFTPGPATPAGVHQRLTSLAEAHGARLHPELGAMIELCWRRNRDATLRQYVSQAIDFK